MPTQTKENKYRTMVNEKIRYYAVRYKKGKATTEEIKILVRLLYEEKKERKKAVWILNQCMGQTKDTSLQLLYLYEALRVFRFCNDAIYEKYETVLYHKLEQLAEKDVVHSYAVLSTLYSCMEDAVRRKDFTCYHALEKIWKSSWKNDIVWKKRFDILKKEIYKEQFVRRFTRSKKSPSSQSERKRVSWTKEENRINRGIFIIFLIAVLFTVLVGCMTVPTICTHFRQRKEIIYLENHNMLLTAKELSKIEKLEQKYGENIGYRIRYFQLAEGEEVKSVDAEKSVCLFVKMQGTIVTYELQCEGVEADLKEKLWSSIRTVLEGEAEDFEKYKQYFQLTYKIIENEVATTSKAKKVR